MSSGFNRISKEEIDKSWKGRRVVGRLLQLRLEKKYPNIELEDMYNLAEFHVQSLTDAEMYTLLGENKYQWDSTLRVWVSPTNSI